MKRRAAREARQHAGAQPEQKRMPSKLAPRPTGEAEFQKAEVFEQNKNFVQNRGSEMVELLRLSSEHLLFCKIGPRSQYWSTAD